MYINPNVMKASALVASGLVVGGGAGYFLAKKHYEIKYRALSEAEIVNYKEAHNRRHKVGKYASPTTAMGDYNDQLVEQGYIPGPDTQETLEEEFDRIQEAGRQKQARLDTEKDALITVGQERLRRVLEAHGLSEDDSEDTEDEAVERGEVLQSIFDTSQDEMLEQIKESRSSTEPYVIAIEEFMEGKAGYDQVTYTYYEGDDTLTDEQESIFPEFEEFIGKRNLSLFGHQSEDENVVYIRNEKLMMDYEICRHAGSYAELHGITEEDYEDARPKIRKMRDARDG